MIGPGRLDLKPDALEDGSVSELGRRIRKALLSPPGLMLALLIAIAIAAPLLITHDPITPDSTSKLLPPSSQHFFGTDSFGFDVFSRTVAASRVDLTVAIGAVLVGIVAGTPLGIASGYLGGTFDTLVLRMTEIVQSFPSILFAMLVFGAVGENVTTLVAVIGFFHIPVYSRLVRSVILPIRDADFVRAARSMGHGHISMIVKHLLPNSLVPVFAQTAVSAGFSIQAIAGLSFLGLGIEFPRPEWGAMIGSGANQIVFGQWWPSIFPGLAVFVTALTFNALGRRLRRAIITGEVE